MTDKILGVLVGILVLLTTRYWITKKAGHKYEALMAHGVILGTVILYAVLTQGWVWFIVFGLTDVSLLIIAWRSLILERQREKAYRKVFEEEPKRLDDIFSNLSPYKDLPPQE